MKIVILDAHSVNPGDLSWEERFSSLGDTIVYDRTSPDEVYERSRGAEAVLTNKVAIDASMMARLPELRYIGVLATGFNVVDTAEAARRGITVTNIPAYSTNSVAQMAFAHILNIAHRVEHYAAQNRVGRWSKSPDVCYWDTPLHELAGKKIGIVGLGNIGQAVMRIAQAFGMRVIAYTSKNPGELPEGVERGDLDSVFTQADIVTLHCPLNSDTARMVDARRLALMKPTAILINTSRGGLVDEEALADALRAGTIAAAGLDVLTKEPPAADNPLLGLDNCFTTPHLGFATVEACGRLMDIAYGNLKAYEDGKPVNMVTG